MKYFGCKFRIYPNAEQIEYLETNFNAARFVYNHLLDLRKTAYEKDEKIGDWELSREIAKMKKQEEYAWLKKAYSIALISSVHDLIKAYKLFFKKMQKYPRFKSRFYKQSFRIHQNFAFSSLGKGYAYLKLPKLKSCIKMKIHRAVKADVKSIIVSREPSGKYYVSLNCQCKLTNNNSTKQEHEKRSAGVHLSIDPLVTTSDGYVYGAPKYYHKSMKRLKFLSRALSRKEKGSGKFEKQRKRIARLSEKIKNRRRDYLHKVSCQLVKNYDILYIKDLDARTLTQDRCNKSGRKAADASLGELIRQLQYKALWNHKELRKLLNKIEIHKYNSGIDIAKAILEIGQGMPEFKPVEIVTKVLSFKRKSKASVKRER